MDGGQTGQRKIFFFSQPLLVDFALDPPACFAFYCVLRKLTDKEDPGKTTVIVREESVISEEKFSNMKAFVAQVRPALAHVSLVLSRLSFGMNLANIFVLHIIVGHCYQRMLAMSHLELGQLYVTTLIFSVLLSSFTFLFIESPWASFCSQVLRRL